MKLLRLALAAVLAHGAIHALLAPPAAFVIPVALAELAGAVLFVVPRTRRIGGLALIAVLAAAAIAHAALGEVPPLSFVVYALAIWAGIEVAP